MNRLEHDLLGERQVPDEALYGIHTLRAKENFPISGVPIWVYPNLIKALACVKQAAAITNQELQLLEETKTNAIVQACEEIGAGQHHRHFIVDVIQGGAGTSTNMNANEDEPFAQVVAALEQAQIATMGDADREARRIELRFEKTEEQKRWWWKDGTRVSTIRRSAHVVEDPVGSRVVVEDGNSGVRIDDEYAQRMLSALRDRIQWE